MNRFRDRADAGSRLAAVLAPLYADSPGVIVLALPRGGVPVAFEVAKALHAPLDVFIVRKLGVPGYEELAMGAIATGGVRVLNADVIAAARVSDEALHRVCEREERELRRREIAYRGHEGVPELTGKTVILIDDGVATGASIKAAIEAVRRQRPRRLVVAVPTAPPSTCAELDSSVDELFVLTSPESFQAVGQFYDTFDQTMDAEVSALLAEAANSR
jgi:predicted phosphoribosyltransferase